LENKGNYVNRRLYFFRVFHSHNVDVHLGVGVRPNGRMWTVGQTLSFGMDVINESPLAWAIADLPVIRQYPSTN
jgi:hypothetical protein